MKIGWLTPFCEQSAIAKFSNLVCKALRDIGVEIVIIRTEAEKFITNEPIDTSFAIYDWTDLEAINGMLDILVINVGDCYPFHRGIIDAINNKKYIAIMHDWYIYNIFQGWVNTERKQIESEKIVEQLYGSKMLSVYKTSQKDQLSLRCFPMTEWAVSKADGVVAHANFYVERLLSATPAPIRVIPLAYKSTYNITLLRDKPAASKINLLTIGHANPNRRIALILEAIGTSSFLRDNISYCVAGPYEKQQREALFEIACKYDIKDFTMTGYLSDQEMSECIEKADIITCLRNPALEGASGSAIEGMLSGRPVIVSDVGFYSELPGNIVFKVRTQNELADLQKHLLTLVKKPQLRYQIGESAKIWAQQKFSEEKYARELKELIKIVIQMQPLLRTAESMGQVLSAVGVYHDDPVILKISKMMEELFLIEEVKEVAITSKFKKAV